MVSRYGVFAFLLVLLLSLPACDSTDAGDAEDMLTQQEADALLKFVTTGFQAAVSGSARAAPEGEEDPVDAPDPDAIPEIEDIALPIDSTSTCSGGGTKSIVGKAAPDLEAPDNGFGLQYDISQFSTDCVTTIDNMTFHVDIYHGLRQQGSYALELVESETAVSVLFNQRATTSGTMVWEIGDRRGVCPVELSTDEDVEITLLGGSETDSPATVEGGTSGRICGISVQYTPEPGELIDNLEEETESIAGGIAPGKHFVRR